MVVRIGAIYWVMGVLLAVGLVGGDLLYRVLWNENAGVSTTWAFYLVLAAAVVAHEGLHGLAMLACGVPGRDIHFGVQVSRGVAFAGTAVPLPVKCFRFVGALPLLVLGVIPFILGLVIGQGLTMRLGALMMGMAGGDVALLFALRNVPSAATIVGHATQPGFHVLPADRA